MTNRGENGGKRGLSLERNIEIGGNVHLGETFEDDGFDPAITPVMSARDFRVKRGSFQRSTEKLPQGCANHRSSLLHFCRRVDCGKIRQALFSRVVHFACNVAWPVVPEISIGVGVSVCGPIG